MNWKRLERELELLDSMVKNAFFLASIQDRQHLIPNLARTEETVERIASLLNAQERGGGLRRMTPYPSGPTDSAGVESMPRQECEAGHIWSTWSTDGLDDCPQCTTLERDA